MPLTLFAHQVPAIGLKVWRPRWFDGVALCIGSMTPDLGYAVSARLRIDTHQFPALVTVILPVTVVLTLAIRWRAASVAAAHLPDLGGFRLHSWRVVHRRQPAWWVTLSSAVIGIATHVGLDAFTHPGRPGVRLLGYDDVTVTLWGHTEPLAGVLQLLGHSVGSLVGLWLLAMLGRGGRLERWYGEEAVADARSFSLTPQARVLFWSLVAAGLLIGLWAGWQGDLVEQIQRPLVGGTIGVVVAAWLPLCQPCPRPRAPLTVPRVQAPPRP